MASNYDDFGDIDVKAPYYEAARGPATSHYTSSRVPEFQEGLCGCFDDCGTMCLSWWCPCIQLGINQTNLSAARIEQSTSGPVSAHHMSDAETSGWLWGAGYFVARLFGLGCIVGALNRSQLRSQFGIEGSDCGDCCLHCWCPCCAIAQESREISGRVTNPHVQFCQPQARVLVIDS